jgi:hypothetical protein
MEEMKIMSVCESRVRGGEYDARIKQCSSSRHIRGFHFMCSQS